MIGYAVSFLLGLGVGALFFTLRRPRPATVEPPGEPAAELPAALQESVTAFGEEVTTLEFDAGGPDATSAVLKEYRAALEAYDRASAARTGPDALSALRDGRAAMIRLDARRHGRPVPIDALPPAAALPPATAPGPFSATGERHVSTGHGSGRTDVLIDRPEPGRPALLDVEVTGGGNFFLQTLTRTEERTNSGKGLINHIGAYRGRTYLYADDATHLRVITENSNDGHRWSIRVAPLSAATDLTPEHRGRGDEVLRYNGGPAVLTVQFRTDGLWRVAYVCQCLRLEPDCDCPPPAWPSDTPGSAWSDSVHGLRDGQQALRLHRPGFLLVSEDGGEGSWYLTTQPVDIPTPRRAAAPRAKSAGKRRSWRQQPQPLLAALLRPRRPGRKPTDTPRAD